MPGCIVHPPPQAPHRPTPIATENAAPTRAQPHSRQQFEAVTVAGFKPAVHVMSTKTRPKRIGLVGSDGKTYTFLLKVC